LENKLPKDVKSKDKKVVVLAKRLMENSAKSFTLKNPYHFLALYDVGITLKENNYTYMANEWSNSQVNAFFEIVFQDNEEFLKSLPSHQFCFVGDDI
jgi:hypothetical protein